MIIDPMSAIAGTDGQVDRYEYITKHYGGYEVGGVFGVFPKRHGSKALLRPVTSARLPWSFNFQQFPQAARACLRFAVCLLLLRLTQS